MRPWLTIAVAASGGLAAGLALGLGGSAINVLTGLIAVGVGVAYAPAKAPPIGVAFAALVVASLGGEAWLRQRDLSPRRDTAKDELFASAGHHVAATRERIWTETVWDNGVEQPTTYCVSVSYWIPPPNGELFVPTDVRGDRCDLTPANYRELDADQGYKPRIDIVVLEQDLRIERDRQGLAAWKLADFRIAPEIPIWASLAEGPIWPASVDPATVRAQ